MLPHPFTSFEIQKYYQNETKFNGVHSRNNWPEANDEEYIKNLDEYKLIWTYWTTLNVKAKNKTYFDRFGV